MKMLVLALLLLSVPSFAASLPALKATNLLSNEVIDYNWSESKKGTVLVFLSSACPCSNAHIPHLAELAKTFTNIKFIGVHSNANETIADSEKYFKALNLPFPVIQDDASAWADRLKAYRTPHAFLITPEGKVAYQGGVTSSADPQKADLFYLKVTLKKYLAGEEIDSSRTRVLGCQIARK